MSGSIETTVAGVEAPHKNLKSNGNSRRVPTSKIVKVVAVSAACLMGILLFFIFLRTASELSAFVGLSSSEFLVTSSPNGTYRVSLMGRKGRPPLGLSSEGRFEVFKNGQRFVTSRYLHSGDAFDLSFESGYPNHDWLRDNVLHFYREEYLNKDEPDTVIVSNRTSETIRYLRVQSLDKFLLFDVEPFSSLKLEAAPPRGDIKWVGGEGEFLNGQKIDLAGANFKTRRELGNAFEYYVSITDHGLVVESPQLEKYEPR